MKITSSISKKAECPNIHIIELSPIGPLKSVTEKFPSMITIPYGDGERPLIFLGDVVLIKREFIRYQTSSFSQLQIRLREVIEVNDAEVHGVLSILLKPLSPNSVESIIK